MKEQLYFAGIPIAHNETMNVPTFGNFLVGEKFLTRRIRRKWRGKLFCYRAPHPSFKMVQP